MSNRRNKTFSGPFKLALILCGLAGAALLWFNGQVASLDDSPNRAIPPSWGFKSQLKQAAAFFKSEDPVNDSTNGSKALPLIDLVRPHETATALFALG